MRGEPPIHRRGGVGGVISGPAATCHMGGGGLEG